MSESRETYAASLCEQIDAGDLDPSAVDLDPFVGEESVMTPALWERLPEAKRETYNERVAERDARALHDEQVELTAQRQRELDTLETAFAPDGPPTATREIGEATLEVRTKLPGAVEQAVERIREESQQPPAERSFAAVAEELIEAIPKLIVDDDEPDADNYRWTDETTWRAWYDKHGSVALFDVFEYLAEPALDRVEELDSFRDGADGRGPRRNRGRDESSSGGSAYNGP